MFRGHLASSILKLPRWIGQDGGELLASERTFEAVFCCRIGHLLKIRHHFARDTKDQHRTTTRTARVQAWDKLVQVGGASSVFGHNLFAKFTKDVVEVGGAPRQQDCDAYVVEFKKRPKRVKISIEGLILAVPL